MKVTLRLDSQTAERLWDILDDKFRTVPAVPEESLIDIEFIATGEFSIHVDRPVHWTTWR